MKECVLCGLPATVNGCCDNCNNNPPPEFIREIEEFVGGHVAAKKACAIANCGRPARIDNLCGRHWQERQDRISERASAPPSDREQQRRASRCIPTPAHPKPAMCECCGNPAAPNKTLVRDHCHVSGQPRGWLCSRCNLEIGLLGDDLMQISQKFEQQWRYLMLFSQYAWLYDSETLNKARSVAEAKVEATYQKGQASPSPRIAPPADPSGWRHKIHPAVWNFLAGLNSTGKYNPGELAELLSGEICDSLDAPLPGAKQSGEGDYDPSQSVITRI